MTGFNARRLRIAGSVTALVLFLSLQGFAAEPQAAPRPAGSPKQTESAFKLREMIANGWPVLSILLVMSIVSIAIMAERIVVVRVAQREAHAFFPDVLRTAAQRRSPADVLACCGQAAHPASRMVASILEGGEDRELMKRAAERLIQTRIGELGARVPALGTIASTAPFVGLFGTVIGIIKAFGSIATHMGGGPEVVAAGVAEALITTAFGLFVAIPAVASYNHLVQSIQKLAMEMDVNTSELIDRLNPMK